MLDRSRRLRLNDADENKAASKIMNRTHIKYADLNSRQKENYNAAKLGAVLANFGYFTMWLNDDYNGADLIALREGEEPMMIQLKSRPAIGKRYENKGLFMAFPVARNWCVIEHDLLQGVFAEFGHLKTKSWVERGRYAIGKPSRELVARLEPYCL